MRHATSNLPDEVKICLSLRELFSKNPCALQFDDGTLAGLLLSERYVSFQVEASDVEAAREALLIDGWLLP